MSIIIENEYEGEINIPYEKIAHEVIEQRLIMWTALMSAK